MKMKIMLRIGKLIVNGFVIVLDLCSGPLGMESGAIPNAALSASSYYVKNVGPETAR